MEDKDAEPTAVECRTGARRTWRLERVGVVRHEHDGGVAVCAAAVVHELEVNCRGTRPEHVRGGLQQRARLGVAVRRLADRVAVEAERHVVEEHAAIHLRHVDPALDAVGERVERADQIVAVNAKVEREVVAGAGGNADERKPMRECGCRDDGERPVAAGDAERVRAPRHSLVDQPCKRLSFRPATITSIPRSRARSARPARVALPPPDPGLTKSTGRRGGSAACQPERLVRSDVAGASGEGCSMGGW